VVGVGAAVGVGETLSLAGVADVSITGSLPEEEGSTEHAAEAAIQRETKRRKMSFFKGGVLSDFRSLWSGGRLDNRRIEKKRNRTGRIGLSKTDN